MGISDICEAKCVSMEDFAASDQAKDVDLCVSMHSCGQLTDLIVDLCLTVGASFLLCPCCYGQVAASTQHPRSAAAREQFSNAEFGQLCSGADFTVRAGNWSFETEPNFTMAKACMRMVDWDRTAFAREFAAYRVEQRSLHPMNCSPKNNVIVGVAPRNAKQAAKARAVAGRVAGAHLGEMAGGMAGGDEGLEVKDSEAEYGAGSSDTNRLKLDDSRRGKRERRRLLDAACDAAGNAASDAASGNVVSGDAVGGDIAGGDSVGKAKAAEGVVVASVNSAKAVNSVDYSADLANAVVPVSASALPGFIQFDPDNYDARLAVKSEEALGKIRSFYIEGTNGLAARIGGCGGQGVDVAGLETDVQIMASPPRHHRLRCRFAVQEVQIDVTAVGGNIRVGQACTAGGAGGAGGVDAHDDARKTAAVLAPLCYAMMDKGEWQPLGGNYFPIASERICAAMAALMAVMNGNTQSIEGGISRGAGVEMRAGLRAAEFLGTMGDDMLVTFVYDRPIGDPWRAAAGEVREAMVAEMPSGDFEALNLLGRSKKVVVEVDRNYVTERLHLSDGRVLSYTQIQGSFSNPNGNVNTQCLEWICRAADDMVRDTLDRGLDTLDFLELYCGNGNHTVALGPKFRRVLCVELDSKLCRAARHNLAANGVDNVTVMECHSQKFCERLTRSLRRKQEAHEAHEALGGKEEHEVKGERAMPAATEMTEVMEATEVIEIAAAQRGRTGAQRGENAQGSSPDNEGKSDHGDAAATLVKRDGVPGRTSKPGAATPGGGSLDKWAFGGVLVDPPRAGLDASTRLLVQGYPRIVYISCNPDSLQRDLEAGLGETHVITHSAVFDQFPYTRHTEVGVVLASRALLAHSKTKS